MLLSRVETRFGQLFCDLQRGNSVLLRRAQHAQGSRIDFFDAVAAVGFLQQIVFSSADDAAGIDQKIGSVDHAFSRQLVGHLRRRELVICAAANDFCLQLLD